MKHPHTWLKGRSKPIPPDVAHYNGTRIEKGDERDPSATRIPGPVRTQLSGGRVLYDDVDCGNGQPNKLRDAIHDRPDTVPMGQPKW